MEPGNKAKRSETKRNEDRTFCTAHAHFEPSTMSSMSKMVRVSESSSEHSDLERLLAQVKRKRAHRRLFRAEPSCSRIN